MSGLSLADFGIQNANVDVARSIWRRFAFLAKYANQQYPHMRQMTLSELEKLAEGISSIMQDEKANFDQQLAGM